ncbi:MAG: AbrB/MazE/SpoVT family DNA-binding domain-containing protein [Chloroflexota bacterium]
MNGQQTPEHQRREWHATISTTGQVTVPPEIRRLLAIRPRDTVAFVVTGDEVRLSRPTGVVERTAGALKGDESPLSAEHLRELAEEAIAEDVIERLGR